MENRVGEERRKQGWTQAQAAEAAGITRQSYAAIESGASVPSTEVALRLARAYGRRVEELFRLPDMCAETVRARWSGGAAAPGTRVRLASIGGRPIAYPVDTGARSTIAADGLVEALADDEVLVSLLPDRPPAPHLVVIGCDPAFGIVADALRRERGLEIAWWTRGSRGAIEALARGDAHVAGAHLVDPRTGEPNGPWLRELVPVPCTRIRFADWEQGLLVRAGNPRGIVGIPDLARRGVRFVNRESGSGSRALFDERLAAAGIPAAEIAGYDTRARSHLAVSEAIASGTADAGVAIRAAGAAYGLEVLPLRTERYELIVPNHLLELPAVGALLDVLRRSAIRRQVEALQGYDVASMGEPS